MKNKSRITIHDISEALGIDSSTVSRALNNSERVSKKTKAKIFEKAKEMGYVRNNLASKLRTKKSNTIGVIVPRISRHFFSTVISGIEETAFEAGYDVIICQSLEEFEREVKLAHTLFNNQVDGLLVSISMETQNSDHFTMFKENDIPVVFFDRPFCNFEFSNVVINDKLAAFEVTKHLIESGKKNIVLFSGPLTLELYQNRLLGYRTALEKSGVPYREELVLESKLMKEDGIAMAKKVMEMEHIDAVFSTNDTAAIAAMQYLKSQNVAIPNQISFFGFSDEPVSSVIEPALSTVAQADREMGKISASLLFEEIQHKNQGIQSKILNPELIIRNSTT